MARSKHQNGGRWIRVDRRLAIYLRDGFRCLYCWKDLRGKPGQLTLDHIKPRSRGGHHESNLITACRSCNSRRQDLSVSAFVRKLLREEGGFYFFKDETLNRIRNHRRRKLSRYRKQAREILSEEGTTKC